MQWWRSRFVADHWTPQKASMVFWDISFLKLLYRNLIERYEVQACVLAIHCCYCVHLFSCMMACTLIATIISKTCFAHNIQFPNLSIRDSRVLFRQEFWLGKIQKQHQRLTNFQRPWNGCDGLSTAKVEVEWEKLQQPVIYMPNHQFRYASRQCYGLDCPK